MKGQLRTSISLCLIPLDPEAYESALYGTNPVTISGSNISKMPANLVLPGGSPAPSNEGPVHAIPFDLGEEGDVARGFCFANCKYILKKSSLRNNSILTPKK